MKSEELARVGQAAQLAPRQPAPPLVPTNLEEAWRLSKALAASTLVPDSYRGQPDNVIAAILMGVDLGISAMQAMREVYVVEGRPSTSALLKVALVRQSPLCESWRLIETTAEKATFETKRRGDAEPTRHTYTLADAQTAGLYPGKETSNWRKRPKLMLRRRCESELADEVYPDVVKGLRTEDEAAEIAEEREVHGTRVFEETSAPPLPQTQAEPPKQAAKPTTQATVEAPKVTAPVEQPKPQVAAGGQPPGPPDAAELILADLGLADTSEAVDMLAKRAKEQVPKDHPLRQSVGAAITEARRRIAGAGR